MKKIIVILLLYTSYIYASTYWDESEIPAYDIYNDFQLYTSTCRYVDNVNGQDGTGGHDGTTFAKAWKTLLYATDHYSLRTKPGYVLRISSGIYYSSDYLDLSGQVSGDGDKRIYIGPYGNGEVILTSEIYPRNSWSLYSGNIYTSTNSSTYDVGGVVVDNYPLMHYPSSSTLVAGTFAYNSTTKDIFVCLLDGTDITGHNYQLVKAGAGGGGTLYLHGVSSITVYGLTMRCNSWIGVRNDGTDNYFYKCQSKFNYTSGFVQDANVVSICSRTKIEKCHAAWNELRNWPRGDNGLITGSWGTGIGGAGWNDSEITGCISEYNGGEGYTPYGGSTIATQYNLWMHNNIARDNHSVGFYCDNITGPVLIENNFSYATELYKTTDYIKPTLSDSDKLSVRRRMRQIGIMVADESYGSYAHLSSATIRNNILINNRYGTQYYGVAQSSNPQPGQKNLHIYNNTIITPNHTGPSEQYVGIQNPYWSTSWDIQYKNNIVYASSDSYVVNNGTNTFYQQTWLNNFLYHADTTTFTTPYYNGSTAYNYVNWCALGGGGNNSGGSNLNPQLYNASSTIYYATNTYLISGSPAIDSGIYISTVNVDFFGTARPQNALYDVGAYEYPVSGDTSSPTVSGISAVPYTTSAWIYWTTDEPANSYVQYGTTTAYGYGMPGDNCYVLSHSVLLHGSITLPENTLFHYRIRTADTSGNLTITDDYTFTTGVTPSIINKTRGKIKSVGRVIMR